MQATINVVGLWIAFTVFHLSAFVITSNFSSNSVNAYKVLERVSSAFALWVSVILFFATDYPGFEVNLYLICGVLIVCQLIALANERAFFSNHTTPLWVEILKSVFSPVLALLFMNPVQEQTLDMYRKFGRKLTIEI